MTPKVWRKAPAPPAGFAKALGLPPFRAHLLFNRGLTQPSDIETFLAADDRLVNDPFLLPDMDRAVVRLESALSRGETIGVFGDFDTDGVTGTALLVKALPDLGAGVAPYLPHRIDEGHGQSDQAVRHLVEQGAPCW